MGELRAAISDGTLRLTIAAPHKRNAMSQAMWRTLKAQVERATTDDAIRLVTISGEGTAFCAGADISEFDTVYATPASAAAATATIAAGLEALDALRKPSIAIIRGPCSGGGCALATACDFRLAEPSARFGINPTALGLSYSFRDCQRLAHRVGLDRARWLLLGGETVDAETALRWGLVQEVHQGEALEARVRALSASMNARPIAALTAVNANLNAIDQGQGQANEALEALFADLFQSDAFRQATRRFLQRAGPPATESRS